MFVSLTKNLKGFGLNGQHHALTKLSYRTTWVIEKRVSQKNINLFKLQNGCQQALNVAAIGLDRGWLGTPTARSMNMGAPVLIR